MFECAFERVWKGWQFKLMEMFQSLSQLLGHSIGSVGCAWHPIGLTCGLFCWPKGKFVNDGVHEISQHTWIYVTKVQFATAHLLRTTEQVVQQIVLQTWYKMLASALHVVVHSKPIKRLSWRWRPINFNDGVHPTKLLTSTFMGLY